ncbi:hypothetical protein pb186bvf_016190 [Paramecium bursaria]
MDTPPQRDYRQDEPQFFEQYKGTARQQKSAIIK